MVHEAKRRCGWDVEATRDAESRPRIGQFNACTVSSGRGRAEIMKVWTSSDLDAAGVDAASRLGSGSYRLPAVEEV